MLPKFSEGYYLDRVQIEEYPGDQIVMPTEEYTRIWNQLVAESSISMDRLSGIPLVMKIGTTHVVVNREPGIPKDYVVVPEPILDTLGVSKTPETKEVLIPKLERVAQILRTQSEIPFGGM